MKYSFEAYDNFVEYLKTKTNCSVLHSQAEADDLIAMWTQEQSQDDTLL